MYASKSVLTFSMCLDMSLKVFFGMFFFRNDLPQPSSKDWKRLVRGYLAGFAPKSGPELTDFQFLSLTTTLKWLLLIQPILCIYVATQLKSTAV